MGFTRFPFSSNFGGRPTLLVGALVAAPASVGSFPDCLDFLDLCLPVALVPGTKAAATSTQRVSDICESFEKVVEHRFIELEPVEA